MIHGTILTYTKGISMAYNDFNVKISLKGKSIATPMVFVNMASDIQRLLGCKSEVAGSRFDGSAAYVTVHACAMNGSDIQEFLTTAYSNTNHFVFKVLNPVSV